MTGERRERRVPLKEVVEDALVRSVREIIVRKDVSRIPSGDFDELVASRSEVREFAGIDDALENGVSSRCPTFDNDILCNDSSARTGPEEKESRFECLNIEVWAVGAD